MPKFFFHVYNGHGETPDEVGSDLEDQAAARRLAIESVRSMVAEDARKGVIDLAGYIDINDGDGNVLLCLEFMEAFRLNFPKDGGAKQR